MAKGLRNISPFHKELAKRVASGKGNQEIMKELKISASRLSVLKSNPLFRKIVQHYQLRLDDAFIMAHEKLEEKAVVIAEELTTIAIDKTVDARTRADVGFKVLERVGMTKGHATKKAGTGEGGETILFEQMLRVVKRKDSPEDDLDEETRQAMAQLEEIEQEQEDIQEGEIVPEPEPEQHAPTDDPPREGFDTSRLLELIGAT